MCDSWIASACGVAHAVIARSVSDEAVQGFGRLDCFASLAMTLASVLPAERDLIEALLPEAFRGARDRAAAERLVERNRRLVIAERPDHQTFQSALREVAARRGEQPPAEAEALELRAEIELVDLAVVEQAAGAVAPVVGIARDAIAELQQRDAAPFGDRVLPPARTAPADQLL